MNSKSLSAFARLLTISRVLLACLILFAGPTLFMRTVMAQGSSNDCIAIDQQIQDQVDRLFEIGKLIGRGEARVESLQTEVDMKIGPYGKPATTKELAENKQDLATARDTLGSFQATARKIKGIIDKLLDTLCACCAKKETTPTVPQTGSKPNEITLTFSFIREDSDPRFNTYGFNGSYTHYVNPTVGLTGDFNGHFKTEGGVDLSKYSVLGGVTVVPFEGAKTTDKVTVSTHALFGISHFKADSGISRFTDNAFTMKLGGAVDVNVNENFFIRPVQIDYAPAFFGNNTQHNVQFSFGAGFRF